MTEAIDAYTDQRVITAGLQRIRDDDATRDIESALDSLDLLKEHNYGDREEYERFVRAWETVKAQVAVCDALMAEDVVGKGRAFLEAIKALRALQEKTK